MAGKYLDRYRCGFQRSFGAHSGQYEHRPA